MTLSASGNAISRVSSGSKLAKHLQDDNIIQDMSHPTDAHGRPLSGFKRCAATLLPTVSLTHDQDCLLLMISESIDITYFKSINRKRLSSCPKTTAHSLLINHCHIWCTVAILRRKRIGFEIWIIKIVMEDIIYYPDMNFSFDVHCLIWLKKKRFGLTFFLL